MSTSRRSGNSTEPVEYAVQAALVTICGHARLLSKEAPLANADLVHETDDIHDNFSLLCWS
jgi:hypothetical protein